MIAEEELYGIEISRPWVSDVVAADAGEVALRVQRHAGLGQQLVHRADRRAGRHHGGGADLEDLDDMRRVAGAPGGDRAGHGIRVAALEAGDDGDAALAVVEALDLLG